MFGWNSCCIFGELRWSIIDNYHFDMVLHKGSRTSFVPPHHFTLKVNNKFLQSTGTSASLYEGSVSVSSVLKSIYHGHLYEQSQRLVYLNKIWDYEYCLWYMFACVYVYSFTASVILFCWQSFSGIVEGTAGHIAVIVEDYGESSSLPCPSTADNLNRRVSKGMHYYRHSAPLYMNPFPTWIVGRGSWVWLLIGRAEPLLKGLVLRSLFFGGILGWTVEGSRLRNLG